MSATSAMPSGRGRLPGMGGPAAPPAPPPEDKQTTTAAPQPRRSPPQRRRESTSGSPATRATSIGHQEREGAQGVSGPYAGEPKVQVNPRIYQGTWRYYEDLVDQLPRQQRRGALTALVNAVLAQHAPRTPDEARAAITWLRQAETRDP